MKSLFIKTIGLALAITLGGAVCQAFPTSQFVTTSKLASGKWVKVTVPTTGAYELTYDELREMGFSNPEAVRIYGHGGNVMSEILDGSFIDDLQLVPVLRAHDKICFYGLGPVSFTLMRNSNSDYFTRTLNTYTTAGYYFLTEENRDELTMLEGENSSSASRDRAYSLDYYYHEVDRVSPSLSGKVMLGENLLGDGYTVTLNNPRIKVDTAMAVQSSVAALVNEGTVELINEINGTRVSSYSGSKTFSVPWSADETYYDIKAPVGFITPTASAGGDLTLKVGLTSGNLKIGLLDYTILTYKQRNELPGDEESNQLRMGLTGLEIDERVLLSGAGEEAEVWEVSNALDPMRYSLMDVGDGVRAFAPNTLSSAKMYVALDPSKTLMKVSGYEPVANQNLHGMAVPDLLIITDSSIMDQAERLAQIHRDVDGIDVAVVDQQQVFNEFSSGAPDVMAYRLLCKMLYDRDNVKFKNLLLLGTGSYDNRQLLNKRECSLLSYESDESSVETSTYASDDFFGMLDDNSGENVAQSLLSIGVGRITSTSPAQCKSDIDKIERYLRSPDYGSWRNEVMVMGDDYDNGLHEFQAEGLSNIVDANTDSTMVNNRVFLRQFYRPDYATKGQDAGKCVQSTEAVRSHLQNGQFLMTYVGHAGAGGLTKKSGMWNNVRILSTSYEHLPVVSMACCNTARWDNAGDFIGMAENMLHKSDGGAIAVMSSGRSCIATDNDALNSAFIDALFSYEKDGEFKTLGEAYKAAKRSFGTRTNTNKLTFNLLGDPAIRFKYPKELFKVVSLNGEALRADATVTTGVMQRLDIVAHVYKPGTNEIDTSFNGDGVATLLGEEAYDRSLTQNVIVNGRTTTVTRDIHYPREKIAQVEGRVVNGVFEGSIIVPTSVTVSGTAGAIKMYAHRDDSDEMVNGRFTNLILESYDAEKAVSDDAAPVIDALYFDEAPQFESGDLVDANVTLRIKAHDDLALNTSQGAVSGSMLLVIDGKVSSPKVYDCVRTSDNGRRAEVTMPLSGLSAGEHTLQYTVYDVMGKKASKAVTFYVGTQFDNALTVERNPASTQATFNYTTSLDGTVTVKVLDNVGNLVWKAENAQFPLQWNLKDLNGQRVPAGVYKVAATAVSGVSSGGTAYQELIVVEPYHSSN